MDVKEVLRNKILKKLILQKLNNFILILTKTVMQKKNLQRLIMHMKFWVMKKKENCMIKLGLLMIKWVKDLVSILIKNNYIYFVY